MPSPHALFKLFAIVVQAHHPTPQNSISLMLGHVRGSDHQHFMHHAPTKLLASTQGPCFRSCGMPPQSVVVAWNQPLLLEPHDATNQNPPTTNLRWCCDVYLSHGPYPLLMVVRTCLVIMTPFGATNTPLEKPKFRHHSWTKAIE